MASCLTTSLELATGSRSFEQIAPTCHKNGIEPSMLLAWRNRPLQCQLPELEKITNEIILELCKFKDQHNDQCSFQALHWWIKALFGRRWPSEQEPSYQAITKSTTRLSARINRLKKQRDTPEKSDSIATFLQQEFVLPTKGYRNGKVVCFSPVQQVIKSRGTDKTTTTELAAMKQKMYATTRNANKRLKRRDEKIACQKEQLDTQKSQIEFYQGKLSTVESQLSRLKANLDKVNHRAVYWKRKVESIKQCDANKSSELRKEIKALKEQVDSFSIDNLELKDTIESLLSEEVVTFEGGKYTDDVRTCIYELLSLNVGVKNVAPIIQCVFRNIAHKSVNRLPSYGLTCQMIVEALTLAQAQLGEKLTEASYSTLQTDGTTKYGVHYGTYDVRMMAEANTSSHSPHAEQPTTYTLGVRHVFSGSAQDTMDTFKDILSDIDSVYQLLGESTVSGKILYKLKNTMSDRHAAEKLFAELLHDYRAEVLPMVAENWNSMTSLEQENLTNMNNFFCGLHYLIGLADCAEETLKLWERECEQEVSFTSGTQRLIRTACKAFHHQGSQQCGSSILFRSYLRKEAGIHKLPLARFVGNRFNIIFYDAAGIFFLRNHMIQFIETVHGSSANLLLQAVLTDLKNPVLIAGCRALGLIDKVVTGPLWRQCSESDSRTQEVLQLIFKAFSVTTQRLLLDHLPGGMYHTATVSQHIACSDEIKSVPTTNVSPERDFAVLDRLLREKPNATMVALESMMIYRTNKTALWLQGKNRKDTHKLLKAARARVPQVKEMDKSRREVIKARQEEALLKKQKEVARKEKKRLNEKAKLIDEVEKVHGGLWKSSTEIEDGLKTIKNKTDKVKAIKLQINYRNRVLCQTHDNRSLFKFSSNRKALSIEQLKNNLHELVSSFNHSDSIENPPHTEVQRCDQGPVCSSLEANPDMLVGKRIRHRFEDDGKLTWFDGEVIAIANGNQFEVIYDGDDTMYCFELLDDIRNGDLIVC